MLAMEESASMLCARVMRGHQFHGQQVDAASRERLGPVQGGQRLGEPDHRLAAAELRHVARSRFHIGARRADLKQHLGGLKNLGAARNAHAFFAVFGIRKTGRLSGARLDDDFGARFLKDGRRARD
jgi:hypothetical protein